jgi:hypothetical protein
LDTDDLIKLCERFNFQMQLLLRWKLPELLEMAISDYEPHEAAAIVLDYKLEELNEGQIEQISITC